MSVRCHKKLDLLIEFSDSVFTNFILKHVGIDFAFKIKLIYKFSSILSYSFVLQIEKGQNFSGTLLPEPPSRLRHEPIAEFAVSQDPNLHFTTFENSIFVQKMDISKTG